jgi:predicted MFS family arabinose efflux permease
VTATAPQQQRLDRRLVALMAFACGAAVANIYYAQPLLDAISSSFGVGPSTAGLLVTASQVGFAIGLALIVPLGDLLERRALVCRMLLVCTAGLVVVAVAPDFSVLAVAMILVGVTSVVAQVLVPFAATLAGDHERGRVVGTVMSGLLIGVLLARTVSGLIADAGGWRLVFWLAAGGMLALSALLWRMLPRSEPETDLRYGVLLGSVLTLVRTEPVLRRRMVYGAMGMAGFSALWTALTFLLSGAPYDYGEGTIGLFGLAGLAGVLGAQGAGRLADRGRLHAATGAFLVCVLLGWGMLAFGTQSLAAVLAGIVVMDFGIQGQHIANQNAIYAIAPDARSRVTTAYMTSNFLWGALGSAGASAAFDAGGWDAVAGMGIALASVALLAWVAEQLERRRSGAVVSSARA